jgi:hypothetical protein
MNFNIIFFFSIFKLGEYFHRERVGARVSDGHEVVYSDHETVANGAFHHSVSIEALLITEIGIYPFAKF